jgi:tetrahydromethanopterin S-methyltransferase subunit F
MPILPSTPALAIPRERKLRMGSNCHGPRNLAAGFLVQDDLTGILLFRG